MSQIPSKQSKRVEMTGWFKHYFPDNLRRNFLLTVGNYNSYQNLQKPLCPTRLPVKKRGTRQALCLRMQLRKHSACQRLSVVQSSISRYVYGNACIVIGSSKTIQRRICKSNRILLFCTSPIGTCKVSRRQSPMCQGKNRSNNKSAVF